MDIFKIIIGVLTIFALPSLISSASEGATRVNIFFDLEGVQVYP